MGVAALTLGLIGAVLFWTVLGGVVLGLLALIFGIVGYRRGKRGEATTQSEQEQCQRDFVDSVTP